MEKKITLKLNEKPVSFTVTREAHEKYINDMLPDNKVTPSHNFLVRCVDEESKETLMPLLEDAGSTMRIATVLVQEFTPALEITLGE